MVSGRLQQPPPPASQSVGTCSHLMPHSERAHTPALSRPGGAPAGAFMLQAPSQQLVLAPHGPTPQPYDQWATCHQK